VYLGGAGGRRGQCASIARVANGYPAFSSIAVRSSGRWYRYLSYSKDVRYTRAMWRLHQVRGHPVVAHAGIGFKCALDAGAFPRLDIRLQAIQLYPYRAGLAIRNPTAFSGEHRVYGGKAGRQVWSPLCYHRRSADDPGLFLANLPIGMQPRGVFGIAMCYLLKTQWVTVELYMKMHCKICTDESQIATAALYRPRFSCAQAGLCEAHA
jgi:hypothetical protein